MTALKQGHTTQILVRKGCDNLVEVSLNGMEADCSLGKQPSNLEKASKLMW